MLFDMIQHCLMPVRCSFKSHNKGVNLHVESCQTSIELRWLALNIHQIALTQLRLYWVDMFNVVQRHLAPVQRKSTLQSMCQLNIIVVKPHLTLNCVEQCQIIFDTYLMFVWYNSVFIQPDSTFRVTIRLNSVEQASNSVKWRRTKWVLYC